MRVKVSQKHLTGVEQYVSLPDVSTLESRPVHPGGRVGYFQPGYCTRGSLQMMLAGGRHIQGAIPLQRNVKYSAYGKIKLRKSASCGFCENSGL